MKIREDLNIFSGALLLVTIFMSGPSFSDTYEVANPGGGFFWIRNIDTNQAFMTDDLTGKISENLSAITSLAYADPSQYGDLQINPSRGLRVTGISGDVVKFSSRAAIVSGVIEWEGQPRFVGYGVDFDYDVITGEISNTSLTAYEYGYESGVADIAQQLGYDVTTVLSEMPDGAYDFQSYTENFLNDGANTNGGLISPQLTAQDGTSIVRQEDDGTVHLGENSLVFAERGAAGFAEDTIYSSNGVLQIGDGPSHRTVFQGVVEVPNPTAPSHAANKRYVDGSMAISMAMSSLPQSVNDKVMLGFGTGFLGGESAFAMGLSKGVGGSGYSFNANIGYSNLSKVGAAFGFGVEF